MKVFPHRSQYKRVSLPTISTRLQSTNHPERVRKPRETQSIFSGIQPTGIPHLGNYLGALRPWVELQNEVLPEGVSRKRYFSVVDLHALTLKQDPATLCRWRRETFAALLAVGLRPEKSTIFMQSEVPCHAELMWILSTIASTGYLSRMTQWKSKLELSDSASLDDDNARSKLKLGLFSYPVLQAADVLLYKTTHVPVGEDQLQHIEFTRQLANSFNHLYGKTFTLPEATLSPAKRVMSLSDPSLKMSKSHTDAKSRILITDTPEEIEAKIKMSVTDSEDGISYDTLRRPGISNLLEILKHTSNDLASPAEIGIEHQSLSKKVFKDLVADSVIKSLEGIRDSFIELTKPESKELTDAMRSGQSQAATKAGSTMHAVREAIGINSVKHRNICFQEI